METNITIATFGGGCFWCTEAVFLKLKGIKKVTSGYAGGKRENPSYEQVSTGTTGHAEVIQIEFDSNEISYEDLLNVFFLLHDPTTLNRQGADEGTQYRSVILYHDEVQKSSAEKIRKEIEESKMYNAPIVTEVIPFDKFYEAEEYHQNFYAKNPGQAYCEFNIPPKLKKLEEKFPHLIQAR